MKVVIGFAALLDWLSVIIGTVMRTKFIRKGRRARCYAFTGSDFTVFNPNRDPRMFQFVLDESSL